MENEIIRMAASQGIWAVLFIVLLFYVLKAGEKREARLICERKHSEEESAEREEKLMNCLNSLSKDFASLKSDVSEMKGDVKYLKGRIEE